MTAARNVILYEPGSHLAGYYRNLVKTGMRPLEATKRAARALVRVIFRELSGLTETKVHDAEQKGPKEGEGDMASGVTRSGRSRKSNISPSSRRISKSKRAKKVKTTRALIVRTGAAKKTGALTE